MATENQIIELRTMINDPAGETSEYAADELDRRIDAANGNLQVVAAAIWTEKAGRYSGLVDVQEGASRRSLGSLHANALKMATYYGSISGVGTVSGRVSRTRAIERP